MAQGSLFLHPIDPAQVIASDLLVETLHAIGLIGTALTAPHAGWRVGDAFLQLLTFMGCSPHIRLEPASATDQDFCHLFVRHFAQPTLLSHPLAKPCRCAQCGKPMATHWQALDLHATHWDCPFCGNHHKTLTELRWRTDAGYGRQFCEVHSIYPGEAQPVDALLDRLAQLSATPWRYFYAPSSVGVTTGKSAGETAVADAEKKAID